MTDLLNSDQFMPHGHCYLWKPWLIWLHVLSDGAIMLAYYSIPILLMFFVLKKRNVPFNWLFLMFALFILACGTTHLMEIVNIWKTQYVIAGIVKLFTALVSMATVIAMIPIIPQVLSLDRKGMLLISYNELSEEVANLRREKAELLKRIDEKTKL